MSDIAGHSRILERHDDDDNPARWDYELPSAQDIIDSRAAASAETRAARAALGDTERRPDDELEIDRFAVHVTARALVHVENLSRRGVSVSFPASGSIEERVAFVRRLPYLWVAELANRVQVASDLDEEEESAVVAALDGPDHLRGAA